MKLTHKFAEMTPGKRPQDPHMGGTGLRFETLDHSGNIPIRCRRPSSQPMLRDCPPIYVPIMQNGKVVDSQGFRLDPEDDDR